MANGDYRIYNNGPSGYTTYNSAGQAIGAGMDAGTPNTPKATYVTNNKGQTTSQFTQGNQTLNVAQGSIFDPLSPNYNPTIANSNGQYNLSNVGGASGGSSVGSGAGVGSVGGSPSYAGPISAPAYGAVNPLEATVQQYADALKASQDSAAQILKTQKESALRNAYQNNQQSLNSQNATVGNNYTSMANQLQAAKASLTPQYQSQRDQSSAEAAAQLRQTQIHNALTGNFSSGSNRNQMNAIGLARTQALGNINQSQNQSNTDIQNRLSDADAQKVAALNDIAQKLTLNDTQYNQGTLDLTNEMASTQAGNAAQNFISSQDWANKLQQQGIDNGLRQGLLDLNKQSAIDTKNFNDSQLKATQAQNDFNNTIAMATLTGTTQDGRRTIAGQTLDQNLSQQEWENKFKEKGATDNQAIQWAQIAVSQQNANTSATNATTNQDKLTQDKTAMDTNELVGRLNTLYTTKDSSGTVTVNPDTRMQLESAILGQHLSVSETKRLLSMYGIPY